MRMLPGLVEKDLDLFGSSVNAIQGLGFKKVELSLQPKQIPDLIERLRSSGAVCAGMELRLALPSMQSEIQTCGGSNRQPDLS